MGSGWLLEAAVPRFGPGSRVLGLLPVRANPWAESMVGMPLGSYPQAWSPRALERAWVPAGARLLLPPAVVTLSLLL